MALQARPVAATNDLERDNLYCTGAGRDRCVVYSIALAAFASRLSSDDGACGHLLCGGFAYRRLDYAPGDPVVICPAHPTRNARHRAVGIGGGEPLRLGSYAGGPAEFEADPRDTISGVTADDICTPGWATDHRHVTEAMRAQVYREYGFNFDYSKGPSPVWLTNPAKSIT
jgi:hypothetical protein